MGTQTLVWKGHMWPSESSWFKHQLSWMFQRPVKVGGATGGGQCCGWKLTKKNTYRLLETNFSKWKISDQKCESLHSLSLLFFAKQFHLHGGKKIHKIQTDWWKTIMDFFSEIVIFFITVCVQYGAAPCSRVQPSLLCGSVEQTVSSSGSLLRWKSINKHFP